MTRKAQQLSAEDECRKVLGAEKFEIFEDYVKMFPKDVDRDAVLAAILKLASRHRAYDHLNPKWCKRRDRVLAKIEKGINDLKAVLKDSEWNKLDGLEEDWIERWTGGLEREYRKLVELARTDNGEVGVPFLRLSPKERGWQGPAGGPPAKGTGAARAALRKAGVAEIDAQNLLVTLCLVRERKT